MSSAVNEPPYPTGPDPTGPDPTGPYPTDPDATGPTVDPALAEGDSPYPAGVAEIVRPLGEVGVLPLGGELDPIDSAEQPVAEVGQLPGVPIED